MDADRVHPLRKRYKSLNLLFRIFLPRLRSSRIICTVINFPLKASRIPFARHLKKITCVLEQFLIFIIILISGFIRT